MASNPIGFQPGNQLAAKTKVVDGLIRSVLAKDDRGKLRKAIESALDQAANGSLPHLDWFANRLDGKVTDTGDRSGLSIHITIANPLITNDLTVLEHGQIESTGYVVGGGEGLAGNPTLVLPHTPDTSV